MKRPTTSVEETPLNPVADHMANAEERAAEREEKEYQLDTADRDKIDKIVLSGDVRKGGKIRITRKGPLDQTFQYVCTIPAEEWDTEISTEYCKKMFGGGDYKCQTFRANGQMYKPFDFSIDYRFKGQLDEDAIKRLAVEPAAKKEDNGSAMLELFRMMKPKEDGLKVTDLMAIMDKSSGRSEQMMMMMMTMMTKSMEASQSNMATMMTAMATLFGGNKGNGDSQALLLKLIEQKQERTPISETLAMMAQIKDIFGDKEEKEDSMWSKLGELAAPVLSRLTGGVPAPALPQVTVGGQPEAETTATPPPPQPVKLGGLYAMMPPHYQMMFSAAFRSAQRGGDPALYADVILDQLDDNGLAILRQHLTPDDWCVRLFGDERAVESIRPWLDKLREMLLMPDEPQGDNVGQSEGGEHTAGPGQP